jgi:hypothetical protein
MIAVNSLLFLVSRSKQMVLLARRKAARSTQPVDVSAFLILYAFCCILLDLSLLLSVCSKYVTTLEIMTNIVTTVVVTDI